MTNIYIDYTGSESEHEDNGHSDYEALDQSDDESTVSTDRGYEAVQDPSLIDPLAEKLFQLCISLLTQRFMQDESRNSPLLHFTAAMGINRKVGKFHRAGRYTPILAALLWIGRLLLLEYSLPKRSYLSLRWPDRATYENHSWRLEEVRRLHLVQGTPSPLAHIVGMLAYGKEAAKAEDKFGLIIWDLTKETFRINDISCTIDRFKGFIHSIVESMGEILYDELMFGVVWPSIDLDSIQDTITKDRPGFCFLDEPVNRLENGYKFIPSRFICLRGSGIVT